MNKLLCWGRGLSAALLLVLLAGGHAFAQEAQPSGDEVPPPSVPKITDLKDLHRTTSLVEDGQAQVAIVAGSHDAAADRIQAAVEIITGVAVPVVEATSPKAALPLQRHLIALGNRSTNSTISTLYNRYYTLLDVKYPGSGGHVVRTVHDPYGNGYNVVFAGGSDKAGVQAATNVLIRKLRQAGGREGELAMGRLMAIALSDSYEVPEDPEKAKLWVASRGYGNRGTFGWSMITKRMALYYMTGKARYARDFLRLAFPDSAAKKELFEVDNEALGNLDDPLAAPYHYYAHLMPIYWDLIEESKVFSDAERLKVTRALERQFEVRKNDHDIYALSSPPKAVSGRHSQYAALSMLTLARYFSKHYPDPSWKHAYQASKNFFRALRTSAWVQGETENLYWYSTAIAPSLKYVLLTGDRTPMTSGHLPQILRAHKMLITGRPANFALWYTSLNYLNKAAYLTGDGSWLHYRRQLGIEPGGFRLGQSFWPSDDLKPHPPRDLAGQWAVNPMSPGLWEERDTGLPLENSFLWASYHSQPNAGGDYALLDGFDSESRNAMHTFALVELRINGETILQGESQGRPAIIQGHFNQVMTQAAGRVEPDFPINSALRHHDVLGRTATAVGAVPDLPHASWQRTIAQRTGRYALVVDELTFRATKERMEVQTLWQGADAAWDEEEQALLMAETDSTGTTIASGQVRMADVLPVDLLGDGVARTSWMGAVEKGDQRTQFSLVTPDRDDKRACLRLTDNAAMLALPAPALAVAGRYEGVEGQLAILGEDHLYGKALRRAGRGGQKILSARQPVDVDWNFETGRLALQGEQSTSVDVVAADAPEAEGHRRRLTLHTDSMVVEGLYPGRRVRKALRSALRTDLKAAQRLRRWALREAEATNQLSGDVKRAGWSTSVAGDTARLKVTTDASEPQQIAYDLLNEREVLMATGTVEGEPRSFVGRGRTLTWLGPGGTTLREIKVSSPIQTVHWWPEAAKGGASSPLLLAGTRNARVIAFTPDGKRAWTFTSKMAPEFVETAKWYWMRPRVPGVMGLGSGAFMGGRQQAFVGSASTLGILNPDGSLAERTATFWGPPTVFETINRPGKGRSLLMARNPTGKMRLKVLNSETLETNGPGFDVVPKDQTYVNPWLMMGRRHIFYEDMNGDGTREVVSDINGTWNRASIWSADGTPLYNLNFGPGRRIPYANVRDFTVTNLEGDDTKEVLVGTDDGWLMALDHQLKNVWSERLRRRPMVFATAARPDAMGQLVVVGCEDGTVLAFGPEGRRLWHGSVNGTPERISVVSEGNRSVAVVATENGQVSSFRIPG